MTEYGVQVANDIPSLENAVHKVLAAGYEPLGGVSVAVQVLAKPENGEPTVFLFAQALIRR
jgi:hypothetical protein